MEHIVRSRVETVRMAASHLHKVLIETLRQEHERDFGRVASPAQLLQLVAFDPRWAWLRPLSQQLLALDAQLAGTSVDPAAVRGALEATLHEPEFEQSYLERLQRTPELVLAHAALQRELSGLPLPAACWASAAEA